MSGVDKKIIKKKDNTNLNKNKSKSNYNTNKQNILSEVIILKTKIGKYI